MDQLIQIIKVLPFLDAEVAEPLLETILERIAGRVRILCQGPVKSGKSTLLNALLESFIFPIADISCTHNVYIVQGGTNGQEDKTVYKTFVDKNKTVLNQEIKVVVKSDSPLLLAGAGFVDSTGTSESTNGLVENYQEKYAKSSELLLVVITQDDTMKEEFRDKTAPILFGNLVKDLKRISTAHGTNALDYRRLIVVFTKPGNCQSGDTQNTMMQNIKRDYARFLPGANIQFLQKDKVLSNTASDCTFYIGGNSFNELIKPARQILLNTPTFDNSDQLMAVMEVLISYLGMMGVWQYDNQLDNQTRFINLKAAVSTLIPEANLNLISQNTKVYLLRDELIKRIQFCKNENRALVKTAVLQFLDYIQNKKQFIQDLCTALTAGDIDTPSIKAVSTSSSSSPFTGPEDKSLKEGVLDLRKCSESRTNNYHYCWHPRAGGTIINGHGTANQTLQLSALEKINTALAACCTRFTCCAEKLPRVKNVGYQRVPLESCILGIKPTTGYHQWQTGEKYNPTWEYAYSRVDVDAIERRVAEVKRSLGSSLAKYLQECLVVLDDHLGRVEALKHNE